MIAERNSCCHVMFLLLPALPTQDDEVRSLLQSAMKGKISIGSHRLRATTSAGQSVGSDRRGRGNSSPVPVTLDTEINQSSVSSSDQSSGRAPSPRGELSSNCSRKSCIKFRR